MNMFRAFMELDKLHEDEEAERQVLISRIKALGLPYNFSNKSKQQLLGILQSTLEKQKKEKRAKQAPKKVEPESAIEYTPKTLERCEFCNTRLTDFGQCPVCDLGEEDLKENILVEWVDASGKQVKVSSTAANQQATISSTNTVKSSGDKYIVGIVSDRGRLRAMSNDGEHGDAFVAFPNNLRQFEGQIYEVDNLIWNGKNYRVSGNIVEI